MNKQLLIFALALGVARPVHANYDVLQSIANITMHNSCTPLRYEEARDSLKRAIVVGDIPVCLKALGVMQAVLMEELNGLKINPAIQQYGAYYVAMQNIVNLIHFQLDPLLRQLGGYNAGLFEGISAGYFFAFGELPKPMQPASATAPHGTIRKFEGDTSGERKRR